ncbi:MAG: hypothetical protein FWB98_01590 [Defluviitaleaceae bacterium]|nr:hypothetical protein [Defluviitaleaceae bacterium]
MKKLLYVALFTVTLLAAFTACNGNGNSNYEEYPPETEQHTLEQMGDIIVTVGNFWELWWNSPDTVASNFQTFEELRQYLLQFYTENYLDTHLPSAFSEEDGRLIVHETRIGTLRYIWDDASHLLVYAGDNLVIVETEFQIGYPRGDDWWTDIETVRFHTHFVDGKIDIGTSPVAWWSDELIWQDPTYFQIILTSVDFWERWWNFEIWFGMDHLSWDVPDRLADLGYARLNPSSGFEDLDAVRRQLSLWYTRGWIDRMLTEEIPIFTEYEGELFVMAARNIHSRPDWETAVFEIIDQNDLYSVVEVVVNWRDAEGWLRNGFVLIDGKIDKELSPWVTWEDIWSF